MTTKPTAPTSHKGVSYRLEKESNGFVVHFTIGGKNRITSRHQLATDAIIEMQARVDRWKELQVGR